MPTVRGLTPTAASRRRAEQEREAEAGRWLADLEEVMLDSHLYGELLQRPRFVNSLTLRAKLYRDEWGPVWEAFDELLDCDVCHSWSDWKVGDFEGHLRAAHRSHFSEELLGMDPDRVLNAVGTLRQGLARNPAPRPGEPWSK